MNTRIVSISIIALLLPAFIYAQVPDQVKKVHLINRVQTAPESVFTMFHDAGMNPVNHPLNEVEKEKVKKAIAMLPPLHQQILREHLQSISFMDSMPNNALTSLIGSDDSTKIFNITFRAGILDETISEWATKKEYTSFNIAADQGLCIIAEAGNLDAIQYVFLHEATHVVDAVLNLTPHLNGSDTITTSTPFTKGIWLKQNQPAAKFTDSLLSSARLRNRSTPIASAPMLYMALEKTPFTSIYSMAAWSEDIAELLTIFHLTKKMNQPFRIIIKKNNIEVGRYEPMQNELVKKRLKKLKIFYEEMGMKKN